MFCSKCGNQMERNNQYCPKCGKANSFINEGTDEQLSATTHEQTYEGNPSLEEEIYDYIQDDKGYYARKWEKSATRNGISFNIFAFLFGPFWLGYRKMYLFVFLFSLVWLVMDFLLYLSGYTYNLANLLAFENDPVDQVISVVTFVLIGFFGNKLYKKHAIRHVKKTRATTPNYENRLTIYKKKGGASWLGVLFSFLILIGAYVIPTQFIPLNVSPIDEVQYAVYDEEENINLHDMFEVVFDKGEWTFIQTVDKTDYVDFNGELTIDQETHEVTFHFANSDDYEDIDILSVSVDNEELDVYDSSDFLDYIYDLYQEQ